MGNPVHKFSTLVREGRFEELRRGISRRFYRSWTAYGLRRDLTIPVVQPKARIEIVIRELRPEDLGQLFALPPGSSAEEVREVERRLLHFVRNIPRAFVAVDTVTGRPCFLQWLMGHTENDLIQEHFNGHFPRLRPDEALLEHAYTPHAYRGKGVMAAAMSLIAERASDIGARYVSTFILSGNIASIKGSLSAGFLPYLVRRDRCFCFDLIKSRTFTPISPDFEVIPHPAAVPAPAERASAEPLHATRGARG